MDKTLQTKAWNCLPREFKEEVKIYYQYAYVQYGKSDLYRGSANAIESLFGHHNLTSDAEGEEMLMCNKKSVCEFYSHLLDMVEKERDRKHFSEWCDLESEYIALFGEKVFAEYFGSKCLPDEEPKPAGTDMTDDPVAQAMLRGPEGDKGNPGTPRVNPKETLKMKPIKSKISVYIATEKEDEEFRRFLDENGFRWSSGHWLTNTSFWNPDVEESKLYYVYPDMSVTYRGKKTPKTLTFSLFKMRYLEGLTSTDDCQSQCQSQDHIPDPAKMVDSIIKDGFRDHNRLYIAAMCLQGMLSSGDYSGCPDEAWEGLAKTALVCADALIKEAEKKGDTDE